MLRIQNITKKFNNENILNNLSATFDNTGVSIIVGINGAGKTTLLNSIIGLSKLNSGKVELNKCNNTTLSFKQKIFYIPSDFYLPEYMTGIEYGKFVLQRYKNSNYDQFLNLASLLGLKNSLFNTLESYSYGMKKKIQIAIMASVDASVILADEIFNGLDFETTLIVKQMIKQLSSVSKIILVSHEEGVLNLFPDDIRLLNKGKLQTMNGNIKEILKEIKNESKISEKYNELEKYMSIN